MNQLDQIENRIKEIIEKGSKLLPLSEQKPVLISHFCEALRRFLLEDIECLKSSPAIVNTYMSPQETHLWQYQPDWQKTMNDAFLETVVELNCRPIVLPEIRLISRNSLQKGEIVFSIDQNAAISELTGVVSLSKPMKSTTSPNNSNSGKILINLDKDIPINKSVINLGRRSNNDIVVNDLRVSRLHAQIRKTRNGYMIFDVGSTGGTFVNGERITSCCLKSGDVISLAGYALIFTDDREQNSESEREVTSDLSNQIIENEA